GKPCVIGEIARSQARSPLAKWPITGRATRGRTTRSAAPAMSSGRRIVVSESPTKPHRSPADSRASRCKGVRLRRSPLVDQLSGDALSQGGAMDRHDRVLSAVYVGIAVLALAATWSENLSFFALPDSGGAAGFIRAAYANPAAASIA